MPTQLAKAYGEAKLHVSVEITLVLTSTALLGMPLLSWNSTWVLLLDSLNQIHQTTAVMTSSTI